MQASLLDGLVRWHSRRAAETFGKPTIRSSDIDLIEKVMSQKEFGDTVDITVNKAAGRQSFNQRHCFGTISNQSQKHLESKMCLAKLLHDAQIEQLQQLKGVSKDFNCTSECEKSPSKMLKVITGAPSIKNATGHLAGTYAALWVNSGHKGHPTVWRDHLLQNGRQFYLSIDMLMAPTHSEISIYASTSQPLLTQGKL